MPDLRVLEMGSNLMPATIRCDQVGSLLRPPSLQESYARHEHGDIDDEALRVAQDRSIEEVVARQEALGLPVVSDGELRRLNFQDGFLGSVAGWTGGRPNTRSFYLSRAPNAETPQRWNPSDSDRYVAVERLSVGRSRPLEEYRFVRRCTSLPIKVTLIGPDRISKWIDLPASNDVYSDMSGFLVDVVDIQRSMIGRLTDAGCRYIQVDEPGLTAYVDPPSIARMRESGDDPDVVLDRSLGAINRVMEGFPHCVFGVHVCRGNQASMWRREGAYDAIAERVFRSLRCDRLLLEYDSERAGGFDPLRFVPRDKVVVLGLVSTKVPLLEDEDELLRKIEEAAKFLPLDQLAVSTQCGFASDIVGNQVTEDDQWRKLELVRKVSERMWG